MKIEDLKRESQNIIREIEDQTKREVMWLSAKDFHVLGLEDDEEETDLIALIKPTKEEIFLHERYGKEIQIVLSDGSNAVISVDGFHSIFKYFEKAPHILLNLVFGTLYIKEDRYREITQAFLETDYGRFNIGKNLFYTMKHYLTVTKYTPDENWEEQSDSLSKAYLYKKLLDKSDRQIKECYQNHKVDSELQTKFFKIKTEKIDRELFQELEQYSSKLQDFVSYTPYPYDKDYFNAILDIFFKAL